ncbi:MAG TPA: hypothetical protein VFQ53_29140 [Kofleriaceae bacterium]|nr:hypothetical protein [Kofleriaceae bacterium]
MKQCKRAQAGMTILELAVGLAITGSLAAAAIPELTSGSRRSSQRAETASFITELRLREEAYYGMNGTYLRTGVDELDSFPTTPSDHSIDLPELPASWRALGARVPGTAACTYVVVAGGQNDVPGSIATDTFQFRPHSLHWYYVLARCYDGDDDVYYFNSNEDGAVVRTGEVRVAGTSPFLEATPAPIVGGMNGGAPAPAPAPAQTGSTTVVHVNAGGGDGVECTTGIELDPGKSGTHNRAREGACK